MAKEFTYRGKNLEEMKKMDIVEFAKLLPANLRRSLKRGFTHQEKMLLEKIKKGRPKLKTHAREIVILPEMVGKRIEVHRGNKYAEVYVSEEMLGHRLGEFALTRQRVNHSAPGIGATKSTSSVSVK